jgi:phosphopentomutase
MEFDLMAFVLGCILGAIVGYRVANHLHQAVISDLFQRVGITPEKMESVMKDLQKEINQAEGETSKFPKLEIKVEQHGDRMYAYRKDSGLFLAQGKTRDELIAMISEKMDNVTLVIAEADGAALIKENPTS